jgi:hypothetical protein
MIKSGRFCGAKALDEQGYVLVKAVDHPKANQLGYVREHVVVAERVLEKPLPAGVEVHHFKSRDDNTCLVICQGSAYHKLLHVRQRAYDATGDPRRRKCKFCRQWDLPENMKVRRPKGEGYYYHLKCRAEYEFNRSHRLKGDRNGKSCDSQDG